MEYSQYCLGKLRGDTFRESNRHLAAFDHTRFEAILAYIHERDSKELSDILMARRLYLFNGTDKECYAKFIRWILRQESGNLSREQLDVFDRLLKRWSSHSLQDGEYSLVRDVIDKYYPTDNCIECHTDHTVGQYELYPLHHVFWEDGCFWVGAPPHIWLDPQLRKGFEARDALCSQDNEE